MKLLPKPRFEQVRITKQRGVVLFFALIAMLAMMLAAVALIRSVDTSTMIAGNLAFKQAATTSGDAGIEAAISSLAAIQTANNAKNVLTDATHPFNNDNAAAGYYSSASSAVSITNPNPPVGIGIQWDNTDSVLVGTDGSGNTIRYIVQRMCRNPNQPIPSASCLFSSATEDTNGQNIPLPQDICEGAGCPAAGQAPQIRITARTTGPKNTVSYIQAFVY